MQNQNFRRVLYVRDAELFRDHAGKARAQGARGPATGASRPDDGEKGA